MAFVSSASRGNNPLRDEQGAYLFLIKNTVSPNISRTLTADPREFCRAGRLLERNFQNIQENRLPGERPDRHPAAGIWERTSPRFHRDRSRRDACPTLRPRPENNPVKGPTPSRRDMGANQARNLFIPDRSGRSPGSLFSCIFWKFRSSSLPARQNSLGSAVGVREIFGETVISIRNK